MARQSQPGNGGAGFTIAEMLVVLLIIGLVAAIALPNIGAAIQRAEETALRENLQVMRKALDAYYADKDEYPQSLEDLVSDSYIRFLPDDPVAENGQGWALERDENGGIKDLRSGSQEPGMNDVAYSQW